MKSFDVDLDRADWNPLDVFNDNAVRASVVKDGRLSPHPCGYYVAQAVPVDPLTGLAAVSYKDAEQLGAFKIDFLPLHFYDRFTSRAEIKELLKHEPDWTLLQIPSVVKQLSQLHEHHELLQQVKPTSIEQVADCLALIRPKKRFMLKSYLESPERIRPELYKLDDAGSFKRSHAISYALIIVLQLHLIKAGVAVS